MAFGHGSDLFAKLAAHRFRASAALQGVSSQPSFELHATRTVYVDAQSEKPAKRPRSQDPEALHQDNGFRLPPRGSLLPGMMREIVAWRMNPLPGQAMVQDFLEERPINGSGVIEIDVLSLGWGQVRKITVKIVQAQQRCVFAESRLELAGEPALSGPARAGDGHESRCCSWQGCFHDPTAPGIRGLAVQAAEGYRLCCPAHNKADGRFQQQPNPADRSGEFPPICSGRSGDLAGLGLCSSSTRPNMSSRLSM